MATKFTYSAYDRTAGKAPRGYGNWAFQRSDSNYAYDSDRWGEIEFFTGTLTEAKAQAKASMTGSRYLALLG